MTFSEIKRVGNIGLFPVLHDRLEVASLVRARLPLISPTAVAVELPASIERPVRQAISRLPKISVVLAEELDRDPWIWICAPGDPFAEALRWAQENERPAFFIDPDLPGPLDSQGATPDPYALSEIEPEEYFQALSAASAAGELDRRRESGMARLLSDIEQRLQGPILVLLGASHIEGVSQALGRSNPLPFTPPRKGNISLRHLHPDSLSGVLPDAPLAHAIFERERGQPINPDIDIRSTRSDLISLQVGHLRLLQRSQPESLDPERRERIVEFAAARSLRKIGWGTFIDRFRLQKVVWQIGIASWERQTLEVAKPWQERIFQDFCRRYSHLEGLLVGSLYEWLIAARAVADDNLAWEIFDIARTYPWQNEASELEVAHLDGELLDLGTRKLRFRRRFKRTKSRPIRVPVRKSPPGDDPREWLRAFDSGAICSYRPEDLVIEDYARFLQSKAISILTTEGSRVEPFCSSFLDGIDIRETMRNFHERRIYVHEKGQAPGAAGSVIVIFERESEEHPFPYCMTWLGEHMQESDMAFYATDPLDQIVGPGIMRATYGGLMMTYPPHRLFDVWQDRDYQGARQKSGVLVMAGIDYSQERNVVHVSARPPGSWLRDYATRQGKRLVHIPLGSLSPMTLKKVRVVHLLAGHDKRAIARDYVW